jgi:hypothetical protein
MAAVHHFSINLAEATASLFIKEQRLKIPATQVLQTGQGIIHGVFGRSHHVTIDVNSVVDGYIACLIGTPEYDLRKTSEETEQFIERWIELCETVQVDYAYFGRFGNMVEDEHLYEEEVPLLQQQDVVALFRGGSHWLYYFGSELASTFDESWFDALKEQNPAFYEELSWRKLPSGGLFVRFGKVYFP